MYILIFTLLERSADITNAAMHAYVLFPGLPFEQGCYLVLLQQALSEAQQYNLMIELQQPQSVPTLHYELSQALVLFYE